MVAPVALSSGGFFNPATFSQAQGVEAVPLSSSGSFGTIGVRQTYRALVVPVNWSTPLIERLSWLTDTPTAYDGSESRISLRELPRRTLEFSFGATGIARRRLEAFLYSRGASLFAMPIWTDGQDLAADLSAGVSTIPVSTELRDFEADALVFLVGEDGSYEAAQIETVDTNSVDIRQPTGRAWPAGTTVFPGRTARLPPSQAYTRFTGEHMLGRFVVDIIDSSEWPAAVESTTYRGMPVMLEAPNWVGSIEQDYIRKLAELDFNTGPAAYFDESRRPEILQTMRWLLESRQRLADFRSWLYARRGKFRALWVPTWVQDLVLASSAGSSATTLVVENIGYAQHEGDRTHRRDVRVELNSGAVYFRRITSATQIDDDTESIEIDSALGVAITPADVSRISFLALSRLESDGVELAWFTGEVAQSTTNMRAIGNDV